MKRTLHHNFLTFYALTKRNIKTIRSQLTDTIIDGIILTSLNVLVFGYLFPAMGMSAQLVAPVFLGSLLTMFFNLGFSLAMRVVFDIKFNRFIDYHLTLPISKAWLFASYILAFFAELFISTTPVLVFGLFALQSKIPLENAQWLLFVGIYLLALLFFSIFFLALGLLYPYVWFIDNIWPRRLTPLIICGSVYVPWFRVNQLSPLLGRLFLLNPVTYVAEGLRSSLLNNPLFLSPLLCSSALIISSIVGLLLLKQSIKKLNPV